MSKQRIARRHTREDEHYKTEGLKQILSSYNGRRFIWDLLAQTGLFKNPFSQNALVTAHETGKMEIGQQLLARIVEKFPETYLTMMQENQELSQKRREELAQEGEDEDV